MPLSLDASRAAMVLWCAFLIAGWSGVAPPRLFAQPEQRTTDPALARGVAPRQAMVGERARLQLMAPTWARDSIRLSERAALTGEPPDAWSHLPTRFDPRAMPNQSGAADGRWSTLIRVSLGAVGGAIVGKLIYDQACEGAECEIEHHAVTGTFAVMGGLAALLVGRPDRRSAPDPSSRPDEIWEQLRAVPVPASPPDSLPSWLYAPENVAPSTRFVTRPFVPRIVLLAFHPSSSVGIRQGAIDLVNGAVIGGESALDGEGFYYILIRDDSSGRGVRDAVERLGSQPGVAVAAPRYIEGW